MKPHPHAEVLRAIADGVPLSEFECTQTGIWTELEYRPLAALSPAGEWQVRRKPKTITVNGFQVPEPCSVMPTELTSYFLPSLDAEEMYCHFHIPKTGAWPSDKNIFDRGLMHLTKEAAVAHAKAMLGIDPEAA